MRTALAIRSAGARAFTLGDYGVPGALRRGERGSAGRLKWQLRFREAELAGMLLEDALDPETADDPWRLAPDEAA
jgi:hypothetical protein